MTFKRPLVLSLADSVIYTCSSVTSVLVDVATDAEIHVFTTSTYQKITCHCILYEI